MKILGMTYRQLAAYLATAIPGGLILDSANELALGRGAHFAVTFVAIGLIQASGVIFWAWRGK